MSDKVRDWMRSPIIVVDPESSVSHAMTVMRRRGIRSLVVDLSEKGKVAYGIVTHTDIRDKIIAADRDPAQTTVREIMTTPVKTANPDWTLRECSVQMQAINAHHMPVADASGTIIGMISATDLFIAAEERGWQ